MPVRAMSCHVQVHLLPRFADPSSCRDADVVIIDVLRATSTLSWAFEQGLGEAIPCVHVEDAFAEADRLGRQRTILGGERGGVPIEGFDLGNSPQDYYRDRVEGRTLVFTSSNGTRALERFSLSRQVLLGAFLNLNALLAFLSERGFPVHLACAGTDGEVSGEDVLFAGAVACGLENLHGSLEPCDSTLLAMDFFRSNSQNASSFLATLHNSLGGRNLRRLGLQHDVDFVGQWDLTDVVPRFDATSGRINGMRSSGDSGRVLSAPI